MTIENIYKEVENYFTAFVNTCNHSDWPEKEEADKRRWSLNSMKKDYFKCIQHNEGFVRHLWRCLGKGCQ